MNDKVSIVIPIYNTEKFLNRCIESTLNQSHNNVEVILVDDESPDNCPAMCDEWAKKDSRIKVVHKKNAGLGMARNSGIEVATGDYVIFLDSDDYIHRDTCKTAIKAIEDNGTDICCYSCTNVYSNREYPANISRICGVYKNEQVINPFLTNSIAASEHRQEKPIFVSACMVMYKAYIFKTLGLRFLSERDYLNEDLIFRIELCKLIKSLVIIPNPFYYYYHNEGTLTTRYKANRFDATIIMFEKVNDEIKEFDLPELYRRSQRALMVNLIVCLKHEILFAKENGLFKALKNIKTICKNDTVQEVLHTYPIDRMPKKQKFLFKAIQHKCVIMIWAFCKFKKIEDNKKKKINR